METCECGSDVRLAIENLEVPVLDESEGPEADATRMTVHFCCSEIGSSKHGAIVAEGEPGNQSTLAKPLWEVVITLMFR